MRALDDSYLRIAKCGRTIGLKGEIVLWPISNVEQRYLVGSIFVDKNGNEFTIDKIRPLKDQYVVKFKGFDNIEQVKKFVNIEFFGEPLTADVLGKIIKDSSNIEHGIVKDVIPNAASDLLENDNGNLIPFRFIESFDDKYVYIDPPEGLFELD